MKDAEKTAYITAEQCVMKSPAKLTQLPGVRTRFDELISLHQINALLIHGTGTFLPFHRYFLHLHEFLLGECGYTGGHPYWDESRDAGRFTSSVVFDRQIGMGSTGQGADKCVIDGPFANYITVIGPGFNISQRCLNRNLNDALSAMTGKTYVDSCMKSKDYATAWSCIYSKPHLMGHAGTGCMNGDSITSAGDPLFYLHHAWVDKLWWDWQAGNLTARLTDMSGLDIQDPAIGFPEFPGSMEDEAKMWGHPTAQMKALAQTGERVMVEVM